MLRLVCCVIAWSLACLPASLRADGQTLQINEAQMEAMTRVTDEVFRGRLAEYLRDVWTEDVAGRDDQAVQALIGEAIVDCARLEVCAEMDIVIMAIARLRIPEIVASDDFWQAVREQRPDPIQRSGAFLGRMIYGLEPEETVAFYSRVNGWWAFGKGE